jgi:hypothetical protein
LLFCAFIVSLIRRGGILSSWAVILTAVILILALASSNYWPAIKKGYIYFFALFALAGSFLGSYEILQHTKIITSKISFSPIRTLVIGLTALTLIGLEFADSLIAPHIQANIPAIWWQAVAWLIPAVGLARVLVDPARKAIQTLFPAGNTRAILFLFVFTAGMLVPIYLPAVDWLIKICAVIGVILGLVASQERLFFN